MKEIDRGDILVRMERSIEINAPPEKVWEMLALDRLPEWMDEMELQSGKYTSEVRTPQDKYRVGATAHMVEKRWEYEFEVTESHENERMSVHSIGKYKIDLTFILKPVDGGTKFTFMGDAEMPWGILGKAIWGLLGGAAEKQLKRTLEKLKSILEK